MRERHSTRARRVRIEVGHDGVVLLVIPRGQPADAAYRFLAEHQQWVRSRLARQGPAAAQHVLRWDGADTIPFAGNPIAVRHVPARMQARTVRFAEQQIEVCAPARWRDTPERLCRLLRAELREEARFQAETLMAPVILASGLRPSALRIADQMTVWGSCAADGTISLSWRLVMAPRAVFRYLVVHEICHLLHRNHGRGFWSLVSQHDPEFEQHRQWLREHGPELHRVLPRHGGT